MLGLFHVRIAVICSIQTMCQGTKCVTLSHGFFATCRCDNPLLLLRLESCILVNTASKQQRWDWIPNVPSAPRPLLSWPRCLCVSATRQCKQELDSSSLSPLLSVFSAGPQTQLWGAFAFAGAWLGTSFSSLFTWFVLPYRMACSEMPPTLRSHPSPSNIMRFLLP